ncbi:hypothetical protein PRIC2_009088 [Phytophthora ramorum]
MVRGQLSATDRKKVVALITIEIHSRDVIDRLVKQNCKSVNDFDWLMQLRFYFNKDLGEVGICEVKQTVTSLQYSYEYQGNNGRLVITPLTDRCVLTMTTALHLNRGGNPLGPAGTGKTETVKDLGKNLAKYVIVFNCSDGLDYKSVGLVAQQVLTIMQALTARQTQVMFLGTLMRVNFNMGIFITMNPGYAGRTELPDNLKALMRPCAMMVPDLALIAEVMLQAEGFRDAKVLAKKTTTLYGLMIQQLSKQDHYDFGLRSLKAVLNMAGTLKREDPNLQEENILLRALRDMNMPKFIREDAVLFRLLLGDLFPSIELPVTDYGKLQGSIEQALLEHKLQVHPVIVFKTIQLYESQVTRHCNMIVGQTMAGKTTIWKTLLSAKTWMAKEGVPGYMPVRVQVLNPKSISLNEIYGVYDLSTFEWIDGILSAIFRNLAADEKAEEKWIMLDGPVDTLWIESMNSVMDDNKVLTLINGDRISMSPSMALMFEVQDLAVASPATVVDVPSSALAFQSRFNLINMTIPEQAQLKRIFETMLVPKLAEFDDEIKPLGVPLVSATIQLYQNVLEQFLPTPANCHYLFNLRDMARVIQGLLLADKHNVASRDGMLRLWMHESLRVFSDRLTSYEDRQMFKKRLDELLGVHFQTDWGRLLSSAPEQLKENGPLFTYIFSTSPGADEGSARYAEVMDMKMLKSFVEEQLENHNAEPGFVPMNLVMFSDALMHILRIHRQLMTMRGNLLLVGVGGSGRQSLTKLAAFMGGFKVFQIEVGKNYRSFEFHEDIKKLYTQVGIQQQKTVFLFSDTQIKRYVELLSEKAATIRDTRDKLKNGLAKLEESRLQVEEMSKQLEQRKIVVAQKNKDCSDLLVVIVSERRVADEQRKQVEADSERIGKEEAETKKIADDAQKDLDEALPALQRAMQEVENLDKKAIAEVKVYTQPPEAVSMVMCAVMILFGLPPTWASAKTKMNDVSFSAANQDI